MPDGGEISSALLDECRVEGKAKLKITAARAAEKVPSRQRNKIGRILVFCPCWRLAIDAITSINTRMGATAFSAPTNKVPNRPTASAAGFEIHARRIPRIRPARICLTRLPSARRRSSPGECRVVIFRSFRRVVAHPWCVLSTHLSGCNKVFARSSIRKVTASGSEIRSILKRSHISQLNGYICLT